MSIVRRSFLKNISAGAATLAGVSTLDGCASAHAQAQGPSPAGAHPMPRPPAGSKWDFSWLDKVTKPHRMMFDTKETDADMAYGQVEGWMNGAKEWFGVGDDQLNAILVMRHTAVEMAVSDEMQGRVGPKVTGTMKLQPLVERGVIVLACNVALTGLGGMLARKESIAADEAQRQMHAALRPGVFLMPNGIFAVACAQEAGCGYFRVG